ncbi:MAG: hypothetical protein JXB14_06600 [Candidatus Altiarchaeota archaeon]|nr:hypothetical protein [Candidatus Altiarchaeota archaeon]
MINRRMMKTVAAETAIIILVGFLLTVAGIYLNFQNLDMANSKNFEDPNLLNNNEILYGIIQVIGMAIMFVGAARGLLKRADVMNRRFVNMMEVFTTLVQKEMEVIGDREKRAKLEDLRRQSQALKKDVESGRYG